MPNWCSNDLYLVGPEADVTACVEFMKGERTPIDFDKIIPYPGRFKELDRAADEWQKSNPNGPDVRGPRDGFNQGGYEWRTENWGTKWPACDPGIPVDRPYTKKAGWVVWRVRFDTAWSPPAPVIKELARRHPAVLVRLRFFECGAAYQGELRVKGSRILKELVISYHGNRGW